MKKNEQKAKISRALRDSLLEASEEELCKALTGTGETLASLAAVGRTAVERALVSERKDVTQVEDLHRGLGTLINFLRRRANLTHEKLAIRARIDVYELRRIELNLRFDPNPRTIYQLEQYFKLPSRSLVILSGAVHVDDSFRDEAVRFAANAKDINSLSHNEKKLLNRYVKFLREYTD